VARWVDATLRNASRLLDSPRRGKDRLADTGALHLDGNQTSIAQSRLVHLSERGRRHGLGLELREGLGDPDSQLRRDDLFHFGVGKGGNRVLQRRQQVGACREKLPDLDEGRPELLEVARKLLGFWGRSPLTLVALQILLEVGPRSEVSPPVLDEQPGDVLVAFPVTGFQRDRYSVLQQEIIPVFGRATPGGRRACNLKHELELAFAR
jgi:hypothetical protein